MAAFLISLALSRAASGAIGCVCFVPLFLSASSLVFGDMRICRTSFRIGLPRMGWSWR